MSKELRSLIILTTPSLGSVFMDHDHTYSTCWMWTSLPTGKSQMPASPDDAKLIMTGRPQNGSNEMLRFH